MVTLIVQALMMLAPIAIWIVAFAPTDIPCQQYRDTVKFPDTLNGGK